MTTRYVGSFTASLRKESDKKGPPIATLLWGDTVHVQESAGDFVKVVARNKRGWVESAVLSNKSLLEMYVIDVGQGDGVLLKTPDGSWHLVDAGMASRDQMTRKGAANFLYWKFHRDLLQDSIALKNIVVTHFDYDHYGGLIDLLSERLYDGTTFRLTVENLYHSGIGRFEQKPALGSTVKGSVEPFPKGDHGLKVKGAFITELLEGRESFQNPPREFAGAFAECATLVARLPCRVERVSHQTGYLPGHGPGENDVMIKVLGPVLEDIGQARSGLRVLGTESVTLNGHSVVLRLDYRKARILVTGDLNAQSQRLLLSYHGAEEFAVDVAKGCHHGSEDVDMEFLKAIQARATVISSGDNEDYSHPRPLILGASARYGRESLGFDGDQQPPLIYSTELARSVKLGYAEAVRVSLKDAGEVTQRILKPDETDIKTQQPWYGFRGLEKIPLSTDLVYGLVNIRTDGEHILCATMEEKGSDFDVKVFKAGVDIG